MEVELCADKRDKREAADKDFNAANDSGRSSLDLCDNVHSEMISEAEVASTSNVIEAELMEKEMQMEKEIKICTEKLANNNVSDAVDSTCSNNPAVLPDSSVTVEIPLSDGECEFSQEKDAPVVSTRVYDFNMVKQKTLPRINFSVSKGFLGIGTSHSRTYVFTWILMGATVVICTSLLIWFCLTQI